MSIKCNKSFTLTVQSGVQLLSYWKLDETVGTRIDSKNGNNLNILTGAGITFEAGVIANALKLTSTVSFIRRNPASLVLKTDPGFSICGWAKVNGAGFLQDVLTINFNDAADNFLWQIETGWSTNAFVGTDFGATTLPQILNAFYFFAIWLTTDSVLHFQLNDSGPIATVLLSQAVPIADHADIFFGGQAGISIDETGIWAGVLSPADRTYLYNGGAGRTYPDVPHP